MRKNEIESFDLAIEQLQQNIGFTVGITQLHKQCVDATGFIDTSVTQIPVAIKKLANTAALHSTYQLKQIAEHGLLVIRYLIR